MTPESNTHHKIVNTDMPVFASVYVTYESLNPFTDFKF